MDYRYCKWYGSGYTWTPTILAASLLRYAENLYGIMQTEFRYVGVDFAQIDVPGVWYPNNKDVSILITKDLIDDQDFDRLVFQISHEVIHVLLSDIGKNATRLEEGLATHFSVYGPPVLLKGVVTEDYFSKFDLYSKTSLYKDYYGEVIDLLEKVPRAIELIRATNPIISRVQIDDIGWLVESIGLEAVESLFSKPSV